MPQAGRPWGIAIVAALAAAQGACLAPAARAAACCENERACSSLPAAKSGSDDPIIEMFEEASPKIASRGSQRGPSLSLSGGGSHGAWGAGVLYGRQLQRGMPQFDLVTGVSTGALMATLVLIGDYEAMKHLYTNIRASDVQRTPWFFEHAFGRAIFSREPLRKQMDAILSGQFGAATRFQRVQQAHTDGRRLFVGTVDLENGDFCSWDLTCIACQGDYARYLDVVMASANAPAIGPPVVIEGDQHVDGGVRAQIFAQRVTTSLDVGSEVYFLVNGKLRGAIQPKKKGWDCGLPIVSIGLRGLELLEHESLSLVLDYYRRHLPGKEMYLSEIPEGFSPGFEKREFPRDKMRALFEAGCLWGSTMKTWPEWESSDSEPPAQSGPWPPPGSTLPPECKADAGVR